MHAHIRTEAGTNDYRLLEAREFACGLGFVAASRVRRLEDLAFCPFVPGRLWSYMAEAKKPKTLRHRLQYERTIFRAP